MAGPPSRGCSTISGQSAFSFGIKRLAKADAAMCDTREAASNNRSSGDPRIEFIANYTLSSLRLKQDKWLKMMSTPEFRYIILDWLNNASAHRRVLVIVSSPGGYLIPKSSFNDLYHNYAVHNGNNTLAAGVATPSTGQSQSATTLNSGRNEAVRFNGDDDTVATSTTTTTCMHPVVGSEGGAAAGALSTTAQMASSAVAVVAAATALLIPLPPASSSFSTLDGVPRGKCVYFVRRDLSVPLTITNFRAQIVCGDLPVHSKIETLALLFDDVFLPLLENPFNRNLWPRIVSKDLEERIKDVRNTLAEIKGKTNNRTILSLLVSPTMIDEVASHVNEGDLSPALELKFRNLLEEMFINWTTQIHEIIAEKSECITKGSKPLVAGRAADSSTAAAAAGPTTTITTMAGRTSTTPANATTTATKSSGITAVSVPAQEITFWTNRKINVQNIYEQLCSPSHKALALILERIQSPYYEGFTAVFKRLICAWREAQDVTLWLQPLLRQTAAFNAVNFSNAGELIEPLVHVLHLIWTNSRCYRSTRRMTVLLSCTCNLLVSRASEDLELGMLFHAEADEGLQKISKTIEVLLLFKSKLMAYKEKYGSSVEILPAISPVLVPVPAVADSQRPEFWRFSSEDVFGPTIDTFLRQLIDIRKIFEAAVLFQSLEKLEIGGIRGKTVTERVKQLHEEFKILFEEWTFVDIDLSATHQTVKWKQFKDKQTLFFRRMEVLEKKLATIVVQAFDDCHNWEQLVKLTMMLSHTLQRQTIQPELVATAPHIFKVYAEELQQIELIVHEVLLTFQYHRLTGIPMEPSFPPIAGAMMWFEQHLGRCDIYATHELNDFIKMLVQDDDLMRDEYEHLNTRRNILTTKLTNLQLKIWLNWQQSIDKQITRGLEAHVMQLIEAPDSRCHSDDERSPAVLQINFSNELFALLKETKYLLSMQRVNLHGPTTQAAGDDPNQAAGNQLPPALLALYEKRDEFWARRIKLIKIDEYYNGIREKVRSPAEHRLIDDELRAIDECVVHACQTLSWTDYDGDLVETIFSRAQQIYQRLSQTHSNQQAILLSIRRWSSEPLHQRSLYGKNLLDMKHQRERVRLRLAQCEETKILLRRLLVANFCLFFNYDVENLSVYSEDLSVQEFQREFPDVQRRKYNSYLKSVDDMIRTEVRRTMKISLQFLHNEMTGKTSTAPATAKTTTTKWEATSHQVRQHLHESWRGQEVQPRQIYSMLMEPQQHAKSTEPLEREIVTMTPRTFGGEISTPLPLPPPTQRLATPNADGGNYKRTAVPAANTATMPLFEVKLELMATEICFVPPFESSVENNFQQIVEQLLQDINQTCDCMPRIVDDKALSDGDGNGDGDDCNAAEQDGFGKDADGCSDSDEQQTAARLGMFYQKATAPERPLPTMQAVAHGIRLAQRKLGQRRAQQASTSTTAKELNELQLLNTGIRQALRKTMNDARDYAATFNVYAFLWTQRRQDVLNCSLAVARDNISAGRGYAIMEAFKKEIDRYNDLHEAIDSLPGRHCVNGWLAIDVNPLKYALLNHTCRWANAFKQWLLRYVDQTLKEFTAFIGGGLVMLQTPIGREHFRPLLQVLAVMAQIKRRENYADNLFKPLRDIMALLKAHNVEFHGQLLRDIENLPQKWKHLKDVSLAKSDALRDIQCYQQQRISGWIAIFECRLQRYARNFVSLAFFSVPCPNIYDLCDEVHCRLHEFAMQNEQYSRYAKLLGISPPDDRQLQLCATEVRRIKQLWDFVYVIESACHTWNASPWLLIDTDDIENECKKFTRDLRTLDKSIRDWQPYTHIVAVLKELMASLRAITELQNPSITERHWLELMQATKLTARYDTDYLLSFKCDEHTTLRQLLQLKLHHHEEEIKNTVDKAIKEMTVTRILEEINTTWSHMEFDTETHQKRTDLSLLKVSEELIETLDDNQMQLQNIASSKHIENLLDKLAYWQQVLSGVDSLISSWFEVQRKWIYLEAIFIGTPDIRAQLPRDAAQFELIDAEFTALLDNMVRTRVVMHVILDHPYVFETLGGLQHRLALCEKTLNDYLETKRLTFPRFYFISSADLLDILSNGNNPRIIDRHLVKLFDSIMRLEYEANTTRALGMHSKENDEFVRFTSLHDSESFIECSGLVELWLNGVISQMRSSLHEYFRRALQAYAEKSRDLWLYDWPAQVALCCSQITWTSEVNHTFALIEEGYEAAMKELQKRQISQLNALINLLLGELTPGDRQKICTICTIDVHSRDVVGKIIQARVDNALAFQWQSQLRHRWEDSLREVKAHIDGKADNLPMDEDCFANICDAEFRYAYEYLGNTSRLVITPLTDRCYITLTQSLHLVMGGAPAGPAGTGKTETTKDLGRALGVMVYVFNCSEQMDYKSCGNIYKGLAQTGAWGCFDEFNRISVEVLSVVAVQVKTIQEAIKMHKSCFVFMGETISLVPSVGIFITMNPGYAGRTELPENLKTLFRPCAMIVPDFALICEIMLMAEGFQDARVLARKFITLYTLCKELLSKQDHYDWGLRAIKSVLVVAGTLKREDHSRPEDQVLMRALRDFNIPKIVTDDVTIFMGLIGDLFPALDVPRKRVFEFEKTIRRAVNDIKLQPEECFLMKVVQLQELLDVRHSVFIVGNAGTGKTKIWQALRETYRMQKQKPVCNVLNPKALSNDELFGIVNPTTREWKDGLFSSIMREQANMPPGNPKWIVLDGDIDPMWIESLNTLMDDNKILTLASNERISLKREMRLLFEVGHLRAATPATVSRAGILYINPQDLGWSPFVSSWLENRSNIIERGILSSLFEKYFPNLMQHLSDFRRTTPICSMAMIQMTCRLLDSHLFLLYTKDDDKPVYKSPPSGIHHRPAIAADSLDVSLELIFVYCTMWGFGSALYQDHIIDWRREFHKWWVTEFKDVKLPAPGPIYDYHLNVRTLKFTPWSGLAALEKVDYTLEHDVPLQNAMIHTTETMRITYFLKMLMDQNIACMLVGNSGCGKGAIFRKLFGIYASEQEMFGSDAVPSDKSNPNTRKLSSLKSITTIMQATHFNYYTSSEIFQKVLDKRLEKKSGRCYAPSGPNCRLIYFVNDLNMPEVDAYGTVQPHTIMRQFMDYSQWYDRQRLQLKDIRNCQFAACMNPTAGSFTIDPRLQRHFCVFSVANPNEETLFTIYSTILKNHLDNPLNNFSKEVRSIANQLVQVGIALHKRVEYAFLPTAVKFHYIFNLRDLTNIYQGMMNSTGTPSSSNISGSSGSTICNKPAEIIRLYVHEAFRVYHDRLVDYYDIKAFKSSIRDIFKKDFEDFDEDFVFSEPIIYSHFSQSLVDQKYMPLKSWDSLYQLLMEAQATYNEVVGYMNLVMFEDAMIHVCRINRILEAPRGNALLIGVGGSGKQTLARLAAFISSLSIFQIQLKRGFGLETMKEELASLYMKIGLKNVASVFLISDAQIPDESLLMLINDMLASGEIPELFTDDQMDTVINGIRNEVKQSGMLDTKDNCWRFFIEKIRRLLKVVLCFSPVGQTLRVRGRKFPAILSRTSTDWFHEWPKTALESVSQKFLSEVKDLLPQHDLIGPIGCFMAFVHGTVNQISRIYLQNEKRYNYTTPKTFLEYIFLYRKLLVAKMGEYTGRIDRLQSGMAKLAECGRQVDTLKDQLAVQEVQLMAKNAAADKLIVIVSAESEKVKREKHIASEEEKRVRIIEEDVSIKTKMCEEDLRKAEPALVAAQAALNTLNKNNLTELKSFGSPPKAVVNVCAAVMVLLAANGKIPRDRSWKAAKLMMVRVDQFLSDLLNYNKDNIHPNIIDVLQEYLKDPEFHPDKVVQKSVAAAGLCAWVINLHRYHQVFLIVGPKQQALQDSQVELQEARERLQYLKVKINNLETKLSEIQAEFEDAVAAKQKCQCEADKTAFTIDLAHRLINGLANENIRWRESVHNLQAKIGTLPGDILLISSFLSYVGCFTRRYREELQQQMWMPNFRQIEPAIPYTEGVDPLALFTDDAQIATWNNEGLPMDRMSTENATILVHSTRWPLMIDPQLQGVKWIKNRFGESLVVIRLSQRGYLDVLERSMSQGDTVLIEQIEETMDTVLEPLLSRALIKKGRFIRIGDKEMDFNANFRLILHTKLANPHYKPEMQAQTTLINFTVTPDGLEEQLLAEVVKIERPDLEQMKTEVTVQQNKFKISLKSLEDELLARLASAGENVLDDHALVINLEETKRTVDEIEAKVEEARITTAQIDETRNIYRAAAKRAAILYFVLTDLSRINPIYKFSLKSFMNVFKRAIASAPTSENYAERVLHLVSSITLQTFYYTLRGLFESDKLTFTSHMTLRIMIAAEQISKDEIDFLLRYPHDSNALSPLDFVTRSVWSGIKSLALMEHFYGIDKDMENYSKRWRKFLSHDAPEREQFPGEWKHRTPLQKLCIMRALRPDRMTYAMKLFIELTMGRQYADIESEAFAKIMKEVNAATPVLFILSPGVDPVRDVEHLGRQMGFNGEAGNLLNISLGQGQEVLAEEAIKSAFANGNTWVILQNIHLVVKWLPTLEKQIEHIVAEAEVDTNSNFRLFISAEPAPDPQYHVIPQGILESSLKIVNEPPSGMAANLHKAWDNFNQDTLETCTQEAEFKSILFALCYFHAVAGQRRKFGPQGWNKVYPFNIGDLSISASVLHNYLEGSNRIPWEDLRYLFGEIMYGGHITDDWDRRLCRTHLEELLQQELIDGDFEMCPGFPAPPNLDFDGYHSYVNEMLPPESPVLYGLHPNAEIGFLTTASETLLKTIFELQPRESELSTHCGAPREELVKIMIDDFLDKLQDEFNLRALLNRVERKTPFVVVALQECEIMNALIHEIKRSLRELQLGLKGELTISQEMERLDQAIFYDRVPEAWSRLAYPSLLGLQQWFADLLHRIKELAGWLNDFKLPCSIWLGGLFNPQSFLTAIMQESSRKHDLPLDRMCLSCDVTKKEKDDVTLPPMEGAFVHSLYLDGASWDCQLNSIVPLHPKELLCSMPVIYIKSIVQEKQELLRVYECPLYKTRSRGSTFVWTFNLKTRERPSKWILGGVALLLQP